MVYSRSFKMVVVSLIPNLLPLANCTGLIGWLWNPAKTIHSIGFKYCFGLSVDDTIHFLAQYRQVNSKQLEDKAFCFCYYKESGLSMFYTSVVLFSPLFMLSDFGAPWPLELIAITLAFLECHLT
jgi:predicted RND superfamily exporter protein